MTRINLIPVEELTDQHLMAEYRELPMVGSSLRRTLNSIKGWDITRVPKVYTLGTGHVLFFSNNRKFLSIRYTQLIAELRNRNFGINPDTRIIDWTIFDKVPQIDWIPNDSDIAVNKARIIEKISMKPEWYKYYGVPLNKDIYTRN